MALMAVEVVKQRHLVAMAVVVMNGSIKVDISVEMAEMRAESSRWSVYSAVKAEILERLANDESKRVTKLSELTLASACYD
ncbi:hypothetical protein AAVH_30112 [Aphelenchoides avenae]|nr:hypothetical protein AAVH_30112 [Aphelenchus avenae]